MGPGLVPALAMGIELKSTFGDAAKGLMVAYFLSLPAVASGATLPPPEAGLASVYSEDLNGKSTASGERYDSNVRTAAHRTLPLGAEVKVIRIDNGKSVRVRINDRGPQVRDRIIDLSRSAAIALGMRSGVTRVKLEVLSEPSASLGARPRR
jgi:rare lipoprotein A